MSEMSVRSLMVNLVNQSLFPLLDVVSHWDYCRGERIAPKWTDIDPVAVAHELDILWAWRWDDGEQEFVGRAAGEKIQKWLGSRIKGKYLPDVFGSQSADVRDVLLRVLFADCIIHQKSRIYLENSYFVCDRLIMPISGDRYGQGGILGATIYDIPDHIDPRSLRHDFSETIMQIYPIEPGRTKISSINQIMNTRNRSSVFTDGMRQA
jgi:hypothetical protein